MRLRNVAVLTVVVVLAAAVVVPRLFGSPGELAGCTPQEHEVSVARVWNEALLAGIRRDVPAPTVHARNLFHTSVAMWDAWAAYDPAARGYLLTEKHAAHDILAARETAISFAAYRVLLHRYSFASGMEETFADLASTMTALCYDVAFAGTEGDSPAALGNRIAAAVIEHGRDDGAQEALRYGDRGYTPVNAPLEVASGEIAMTDPNRWQPLALSRSIAQNGLPIPAGVQRFSGSQWGHVRAFALPASTNGVAVDPGPPPQLGGPSDAVFKAQAIDVLRRSSHLDPGDDARIDISPAALGANPLGTNDGKGHEHNPITGEPYEANVVRRGDFARVMAEFWADGPASETPPGHWNTIANEVTATAGFERRIGGVGPVVDPLEWDVKLYFALNGALHDAGVAAWGVKRHYDSARPISMIRYMGFRGQSSDPQAAAYHPDGLPLEAGLVELVTSASSAPGQRHEHLAEHVDEVAVYAWHRAGETTGVTWIRAVDWVPYQLATFVSPAFSGYVSGHSTFSRAAAEVLAQLTGSPDFPGGLAEWTVRAGELRHEEGPTEDVVLQAATYYDAADQAGLSRLYGGIHISADDLVGRRLGARCGRDAWESARRYFDGSPQAGGTRR